MKQKKIGFVLEEEVLDKFGFADTAVLTPLSNEIPEPGDFKEFLIRVFIDFCIVYGCFAVIRNFIQSLL